MNFSADAYDWAARSIGVAARNLKITRIEGATSSSVFLVCCEGDFLPQRFVFRVLDNREWLAAEPDLASP